MVARKRLKQRVGAVKNANVVYTCTLWRASYTARPSHAHLQSTGLWSSQRTISVDVVPDDPGYLLLNVPPSS
jgi:hypothetical protein